MIYFKSWIFLFFFSSVFWCFGLSRINTNVLPCLIIQKTTETFSASRNKYLSFLGPVTCFGEDKNNASDIHVAKGVLVKKGEVLVLFVTSHPPFKKRNWARTRSQGYTWKKSKLWLRSMALWCFGFNVNIVKLTILFVGKLQFHLDMQR